MPVYKYLDLSIAHITRLDAEKLENVFSGNGLLPLIYRKDDYGWWIHVPVGCERRETIGEIQEALTEHGFSLALISILNHAAELNCYWINLDQGGEVEPGLQTYEW